ncbi:MAG: hypothetical protein ACI9RU_002240 [Litorivivens sp.]|jgi:hypothetical protein
MLTSKAVLSEQKLHTYISRRKHKFVLTFFNLQSIKRIGNFTAYKSISTIKEDT